MTRRKKEILKKIEEIETWRLQEQLAHLKHS